MDVDKVRRATEMLYNLNCLISIDCFIKKARPSLKDMEGLNESIGRIIMLLREADDEKDKL
jgi:hypothetical protein